MKSIVVVSLMIVLVGCAGTTFHEVDSTGSSKKADSGLRYYMPVPHLLVQRPLNKDGAITSKIIYLPDTSKQYSMKYKRGLGSGKMEVTFTGGMIASFNQESDAKLPELLANLAAPASGVAGAAASFATAELTEAQAAEIRHNINSAAISSNSVSALMTDNGSGPFDDLQNSNLCAPGGKAFNLASPYSPTLNRDQAISLTEAANHLACGVEKMYRLGLLVDAQRAAAASLALYYVTTSEFYASQNSLPINLNLGDEIEASVIRAYTKEWADWKSGLTSDEAKEAEGYVGLAVKGGKSVADELAPPAAQSPKSPFELYRIDITSEGTTLKKVE